MALSETQKKEVFQALGEASMSWSESPNGVFDSANCTRIGNELIEKLEEDHTNEDTIFKMLHEFREWDRDWDKFSDKKKPISADEFVKQLSKKYIVTSKLS